MDGKKLLLYQILDKFTEADGSTRLYVGRESVFPGPSGWPIPHDAPYKAQLDRWIMTIIEAGLYEKWLTDILRETKLKSQRRQQERQARQGGEARAGKETGGSPVLTINHTQGAFLLLLLGAVLASLAFTREILLQAYCDDYSSVKFLQETLNYNKYGWEVIGDFKMMLTSTTSRRIWEHIQRNKGSAST
ncbi:uncharacterized protein LOC126996355 [Eriocheir sinensis]|uniref:uncharacterized protein LOC126996355 n=1 Tax=Eriocheir sinensis TaxID=95602 RepID=UPI0021C5A2EB|nr:uncharacterized protein LOC126996355 [Eriocheir sinensis]